MSKGRACVFSTLAAVIALALPANAQSVISIRSGVVHYFDGAVYLGDQPLESHLGTFACVPLGGELRTAEGRAEVLLTPGAFLRLGDRSAIRMVANDLADTQVELRAGSAIVELAEPNPGTSVTLIYKDWRVHFLQKGVYRMDSDPPRLWVSQGEAEVLAGPTGQPVTVGAGLDLPFGEVLVPEQSSGEPNDALSDWAKGRGESISADNAITAQIGEDPALGTLGLDGFTYFPFLGVPAYGLGSYDPYSPYGSYTTYQAGFNSIYLPGYTYPPLLFGVLGRGLGARMPSLPGRIGILPGQIGVPGRIGVSPGAGTLSPISRSPVMRAPVPPATPIHAAPRVVAPHVAVPVGVHR
jgi:hypothetical protein